MTSEPTAKPPASNTAAAIDIGTNSVKLTVGRRYGDGALEILLDTVTATRLGKGVDAAGRLNDEAIHRTLTVLASFAQEARNLGAARIAAIGTSALRDAVNGAEFVHRAARDIEGAVEIVSGDREAALVYASARRDPDLRLSENGDASIAATDVGGGSTEIVLGRGDAVLFRTSLQIGAVRLTERALPGDPPSAASLAEAAALVDAALSEAMVPNTGTTAGPVIAVASGGTIANLVAMKLMGCPEPPAKIMPDLLHGVRLTAEEIERRTTALAALPLAERRQVPGLEPDRADVIVAGAIIQARALRRLGAAEVIVSARGLRFGLLYELLDERQGGLSDSEQAPGNETVV